MITICSPTNLVIKPKMLMNLLLLTLTLSISPWLHSRTLALQAKEVTAKLPAILMTAQPGDIIQIPAGHFYFTQPLSVRGNKLTISGADQDATTLDFTQQNNGAQSFLAVGQHITIKSMTLLNPHGDGLVVRNSHSITIDQVTVSWDQGLTPDSGDYGIYPVKSKQILIKHSRVNGAREAGIYVGQSIEARIENCHTYGNVGGIEAENVTDLVIRNNHVHHNAIGMVISAVPELTKKRALNTTIAGNRLYQNNISNLAAPGNLISTLPSGIGLIILAADQVTIAANQFSDHTLAHLLVAAYSFTGKRYQDIYYDPFAESIYLGKNSFTNATTNESQQKYITIKQHTIPSHQNILWDGIVPTDYQAGSRRLTLTPAEVICSEEEVPLLNLVDMAVNDTNAKVAPPISKAQVCARKR